MIGILDSGLGGLSAAAEIRRRLPDLDILYFGDTAHFPYGGRPTAVIQERMLQGARFLLTAGVEAIALSSHTAACVAATRLEENIRIPVFSIADETMAAAIGVSRRKTFGVMGSPAVVDSHYYLDRLQAQCPGARVHAVSAPLPAALAEEGWIRKPETAMIVKKHLLPLKTRQIDTLILASNHFRLLEKIVERKAGARVKIVQGGVPLAERVQRHYAGISTDFGQADGPKGRLRVVVTEKTAHHEKNAQLFFGRRVTLETDR